MADPVNVLVVFYSRYGATERLALAAVLVALLGGCAPDKFRATDITGADFARNLQLTAHDGKPRTLRVEAQTENGKKLNCIGRSTYVAVPRQP